MSLAERLRTAATSAPDGESWLCVGLDPLPDRTPPEDILRFNERVVDATADFVCAYKPQSAFYEAAGIVGWQALKDTIEYIRQRAPHAFVIWDAKRGDVKHVAKAYAVAAFEHFKVDAVTVNPYLGVEGVQPFLDHEKGSAIVCTHTSNPGASEVQDLPICDDARKDELYLKVAEMVKRWGSAKQNAGLVVGATYPEELANVRQRCPDLPILLPGVGAQGGDLDASVAAGLDARGGGLLVSASRSVIYAGEGASDVGGTAQDKAVQDEARRLRDDVRDAIHAGSEGISRAVRPLEVARV